MGLLEEALLIAGRGRPVETTSDRAQAGRSDASLNADQNAAELRDDSRSQSYALSLPTTSSSQTASTSAERLKSCRASERRPSYRPKTPSPLNPSTSNSSISTDGSQEISGGSASEGAASSIAVDMQEDGKIRPRHQPPRRGNKPHRSLTPMQQLLHQKSVPAVRAEAPNYSQDLGRHYSRYPATPVDSPRESRFLGSRTFSSTYFPGFQASLTTSPADNPFSGTNLGVGNGKREFVDDLKTYNPYSGDEKGYILYNDEAEDDDGDHMPNDDDDIVFRTKFGDYFSRRNIVSTVGATLLILGILTLFIVLPVTFFLGKVRMPLPGVDYSTFPDPKPPRSWTWVNDNNYSLLINIRSGLIDPETPESAKIRKSTFDGADLHLVFSDEFSKNNRTFYPGDDPYWTAPNLWYGATQDMDWYDPDAVTTYDGTLQLRLDQFPNHNLLYRSGMLNSWNQMCFKGGVFEVSLSLPGPSGIPGLWPGVWSMGNLGRPGYKATTEGIWPYTYNSCDSGITPNQSSPDGLSELPGQKLPSCTCDGEDHPSPGTGRGAPEIDILEASVDPTNRIGVVTQSFQVAPFDVFYRPNSEFLQIPNYNTTSMNGYCGGPFQQAISGTTLLNNNWYDGIQYQKYAFEYEPGTSEGKIAWFVGDDQSFMMDGRAVGQNGNVAPRVVSEEPMSLVLNLGLSSAWSEILIDQLKFPTVMRIDYVRIYQRPGSESITCDPPGYPTTEYIERHPVAYNNPNLTAWNETGYKWPANHMQSNC